VGLDANVALLVAALDLKVVQLLRDAIRTTAAAAGEGQSATPLGPAPSDVQPRRRYEPEPYIEPRKRIEPTPYIEPRERITPQPRVELAPVDYCCGPCEPAPRREAKPVVFQPPWRSMPVENSAQPATKVKVIKIRPDIVRKGSLIDCFI
jgi:hypothetical protein